MATAEEEINGGAGDRQHLVEMITSSESADGDLEQEIAPLLTQPDKPKKINIFSVSFARRRPKDQLTRLYEVEISAFSQFLMWVWGGSRYSGFICMVASSIVYCSMGVVSDIFSGQAIPLLETAFTRCTIILMLSYFWLRKSGKPILGPVHARKLLISRAVMGSISFFGFLYCLQYLPLSQAILLSFTTPIIASVMARIILHEMVKMKELGVLACSFFGVFIILHSTLSTQGGLVKSGEVVSMHVSKSHHIYAVLIGLLSSLIGGISYCLIRAGAKASDQPLVTVFSFGILATPLSGICALVFSEFVLPSLSSFFLMVALGVLAFFAEVLLARALQLEKTSKVVNILYIEAALSQLWGMSSLRQAVSFSRLIGCLLIFISASCTMFIEPDKEAERDSSSERKTEYH